MVEEDCSYWCSFCAGVNSARLIAYRKVFIFAGDVFLKAEVAELGKGARLRALFRRDPRVQIPSSAHFTMFFSKQSSNSASLTKGYFRVECNKWVHLLPLSTRSIVR
jgi:hypothetical protein